MKWWQATARFTGSVAGKPVRCNVGDFLYGEPPIAAVWWNEEHREWTFVAKDGMVGADRGLNYALRLASGDIHEVAE